MVDEMSDVLLRVGVAVLAGGLVGLERSYQGRPAGFRTHTLVCMASSLLMLVTIYQGQWFAGVALETVRIDPTRMAQGVMTGIGFLGAGVIMREGLSVRGLTTAASIWITAAIGILAGVGRYSAVIVGTVLTLGTLTAFRWIESRLPVLVYVHYSLRFHREEVMPEQELRDLVSGQGFSIANLGYAITDEGRYFEYLMVIRTRGKGSVARLSQAMKKIKSVIEFRISPTGD